MVRGLEKFKEFFENYNDNYVLIGGTACSIIFDEIGEDFRATKDLDIVLIIENINEDFGNQLWKFIEAAGYTIEIGKQKKFYRFSNPTDKSYPKMIELFSRKTNINLFEGAHLEPIHISDEVSSLSAILLNDAYYNFLLSGKRIVDGYNVLDEKHLIPFKAKAWCEMTDRQKDGEEGLSKHIKKHFRDVYRLSRIIVPTDKVNIEGIVYDDMVRFINNVLETENKSDDINYRELYDLLTNVYL